MRLPKTSPGCHGFSPVESKFYDAQDSEPYFNKTNHKAWRVRLPLDPLVRPKTKYSDVHGRGVANPNIQYVASYAAHSLGKSRR